jgi:hypothetical protein
MVGELAGVPRRPAGQWPRRPAPCSWAFSLLDGLLGSAMYAKALR